MIPLEFELKGPFRLIHLKNKNYIITSEGDAYLINPLWVEKVNGFSHNVKQNVLVIDKNTDTLYSMKKDSALQADGKTLRATLRESALCILE